MVVVLGDIVKLFELLSMLIKIFLDGKYMLLVENLKMLLL